MRSPGLESASGLRPASAFVIVAAVLFAVTGKAAHIAFLEDGDQIESRLSASAPWPEFEIADRKGRPLALSVECFDLTVSPRSMWRFHTPAYMAERIATVLGDATPREVLDLMLPRTADEGIVRVERPALLVFDVETALAVERWLETGATEQHGDDTGPIDGMWLVPGEREGTWTIAWRPEDTLSIRERARHLAPGSVRRPEIWTARLLRNLATFVRRSAVLAELEVGFMGLGRSERAALLRERIWAELLPCEFRVVRHGIGPETARALQSLLAEEAVTTPWQMELVANLERRHPVRPRGDDRGDPAADDPFGILGHWGVLGPEDALARARRELGLRDTEGYRNEEHRAYVERRAHQYETERRPRSGLEMLCGEVLEHPEWKERLKDDVRTYDRRVRNLPRDRRRPWKGHVPDYFQSATDAAEVPRVITTIDAELQRAVHRELEGVMATHDPALAMAIVLEVESGDVLAVDGIHAYGTSGFAPLLHRFTPGSTMKAIVMAIALDEGLVTPGESIATFAPDGLVVRDDKGHTRHISEALGAPEESHVTAAQGLARSVNAVLVQIGLRIDAARFRERLVQLGYTARPRVGLGPEDGGYVPELERGTWKVCHTHASVSFGHELSTTLWQHASALSTIVRGGERRPLRLVEAVEQDGLRWQLPPAEGVRVLGERACGEVRAMMALGASEGTGRRVAHPSEHPEFDYIGTKTGTTQKVPTELCLHVELPHNVRHELEGSRCTRACRKSMVGARDHARRRRTCYTSSMCVVGRLPGSSSELLVFLVVEDPRSSAKFGSDVAGPAAVAILRRAFGLPPKSGAQPEQTTDAVPVAAFNTRDFPWAEDIR